MTSNSDFQRSPDWHVWRSQGIGSSDASSIMGCNPWKNIVELWLEKTKQKCSDFVVNTHMQRGIDLEPNARALAEYMLGRTFKPTELIHPEFDYIRASLDGLDESGETVLEIKCPTQANFFKLVASGEIADMYYCQMQHQMLCAPKSKQAVFFNYLETDRVTTHLILDVPKDGPYIEELRQREHEFWHCVKHRIEPKLPVRGNQGSDFYKWFKAEGLTDG